MKPPYSGLPDHPIGRPPADRPHTKRRNVRRVWQTALAATLLATATASAQRPIDPALTRVESLISAGLLQDARVALDQWNAEHPPELTGVRGADRATAGILEGRLARTWNEAVDQYLAVALGYPATRQAPEALFRLGQGFVAAAAAGAEPDAAGRAVAYLERLVADYPTAPQRASAFLWLARALRADGRRAAACDRLDLARTVESDSVTAALIEADRTRQCNGSR